MGKSNLSEQVARIIHKLSTEAGVSGYEAGVHQTLRETLGALADEFFTDSFGNFYALKKGTDSLNSSVMLAAHLDEIGLMVTRVDDRGFLHFTMVGGIDERTLACQEVMVHGRQDLPGIVCLVPSADAGSHKAVSLEDLVIDIGCSKSEAVVLVNPGDIVSLCREPVGMLNNRIAGKALDDRAGLAVLFVCFQELSKISHRHDVLAVATAQEEVGIRGAEVSVQRVLPSVAVAIDVTHAQTADTKNLVAVSLDKGPVITLGPNIHQQIFAELTDAAKENRIPFQLQPVPGPTGTDARILQLTGQGIPTGLVSIPLRYMHTSVETVSVQDIVDSGKLLACFIGSLPADLEELACF